MKWNEKEKDIKFCIWNWVCCFIKAIPLKCITWKAEHAGGFWNLLRINLNSYFHGSNCLSSRAMVPNFFKDPFWVPRNLVRTLSWLEKCRTHAERYSQVFVLIPQPLRNLGPTGWLPLILCWESHKIIQKWRPLCRHPRTRSLLALKHIVSFHSYHEVPELA